MLHFPRLRDRSPHPIKGRAGHFARFGCTIVKIPDSPPFTEGERYTVMFASIPVRLHVTAAAALCLFFGSPLSGSFSLANQDPAPQSEPNPEVAMYKRLRNEGMQKFAQGNFQS